MHKTKNLLAVSAAMLFAAPTVMAHECRLLGNGNENIDANFDKRYYICLGFLNEDPKAGQPGKGKPNNLDFLPVYFEDVNTPHLLNAAKGDKVDIQATVYWMNGRVFPTSPQDVPHIGYESPIALDETGKIKWKHTITDWVQRKSLGLPSYGDRNDFILPYRGMYAWVVEGTLQRQGAKPVYFIQKYTCQQPRDPSESTSFFDCARY